MSSCRPSRDQKALKQLLKGNYGLLSPEEKRMASTLVAAGQQHLFQHWPAPGASAGVDVDSRIHPAINELHEMVSLEMCLRAEPFISPCRHQGCQEKGAPQQTRCRIQQYSK